MKEFNHVLYVYLPNTFEVVVTISGDDLQKVSEAATAFYPEEDGYKYSNSREGLVVTEKTFNIVIMPVVYV